LLKMLAALEGEAYRSNVQEEVDDMKEEKG
jgi:hypothetical protein